MSSLIHINSRIYIAHLNVILNQPSQKILFDDLEITGVILCGREMENVEHEKILRVDLELTDCVKFFNENDRVLVVSDNLGLAAAVVVAYLLTIGDFSTLDDALGNALGSLTVDRAFLNQIQILEQRWSSSDAPIRLIDVNEHSEWLPEARRLVRQYADSLGFALDFQSFSKELAALPAEYVPERRGCLFVAALGGIAVGVGAVRSLPTADNQDGSMSEMKRLFICPASRRRGIARLLSERLVAFARSVNYSIMFLDTVAEMIGARKLYRSLGFNETTEYIHNPLPTAMFFKKDL